MLDKDTVGSSSENQYIDFQQEDSPHHIHWPLPSGSLYAHFKKAAVASDHGLCSEIGRDVLIDGGNAVDSMIATLLCIGVVNPQSSGLGGGFLMTLFNAWTSTGRCQTINARETAPLAATEDMYKNDSRNAYTFTVASYQEFLRKSHENNATSESSLFVAVPRAK
ncbi:hypothetical protein COOONC_09051 [Cooperia oncophora]